MTIEKAREILWAAYNTLSDEQIIKLIQLFEAISRILIEKETAHD